MDNINATTHSQNTCHIGCTYCKKCIAHEILGERLDRMVYKEKAFLASEGYLQEALAEGRESRLCIQIATAIKVHSPQFDTNKSWWKENRTIWVHDVVDPTQIQGKPIFIEDDNKWVIKSENPLRTILFETTHFLIAVTYDDLYMRHDHHIYICKIR